jgi:2-oxoglutarate ferredoxin oxidoreductase subunit beta
MTGGQMAPTTLIGQKTLTTKYGRDAETTGMPIKICEVLDELDKPVYIERVAVNDAANIAKTKNAIKKAFLNQIEGKGYSFVEVLSMCPTNWKMNSVEAFRYVGNEMASIFPIGKIRDKT